MAKYAGVVKKYSTMLEMFIKEYFCDMVRIYYRIFTFVHAHRFMFTLTSLQNNIPQKNDIAPCVENALKATIKGHLFLNME
jgi:hypothetical protein